MFTDYYQTLEVDINATPSEIKAAFKKQAMKWHPDRNPGVNTNDRMRLIIEAHLILKDPEARKRYNLEYHLYKTYEQSHKRTKRDNSHSKSQEKQSANTDQSYTVTDDVLKRWMENARRQASEYLAQTIADFRGMVGVGASTFASELASRALQGIGILVIVALLMKACN
jgi:curved DNA-binding protein CbpA